jgi:predicted nucleotidyltransferase
MTSGRRPEGPPAGLDIPRNGLAEICRRYRVRRLALFGSALREDLGPESDLDLLVEFLPGETPGLAFFALQDELSRALGRTVDLNTPGFLGPELRAAVMAEAEPLYVAA